MKILKYLLIAFGAFVVFLAILFVAAGVLIPSERSFTNEIDINAPAGSVWNVIGDRGRFTEWQPNLTRVEIVDNRHWVEYPKDSPEPLHFSLNRDDRPAGMVFDYTMGDSFSGKWTGIMTPTANGVHLTTVDGYSAKGWFTKVLIWIFFDYDKFAKDWNQKLKTRARQGS